MPPWHPKEGHVRFRDSQALAPDERCVLLEWIEGGMPAVPADALLPSPVLRDGWRLVAPDLLVEMPRAFGVPASGPDLYRNLAVPLGLAEDR